jgi:Tat protein translocase TatB subunit
MDSFFGIGFAELFFIAIIALIVLGPERLPGAIREVAKHVRYFRNLSGELMKQFSKEMEGLEDLHPQNLLKEFTEDPKAAKSKTAATTKPASTTATKPKPTTTKPASTTTTKPATTTAKPTTTKPAATATDGDKPAETAAQVAGEAENSILPPPQEATPETTPDATTSPVVAETAAETSSVETSMENMTGEITAAAPPIIGDDGATLPPAGEPTPLQLSALTEPEAVELPVSQAMAKSQDNSGDNEDTNDVVIEPAAAITHPAVPAINVNGKPADTESEA